MCVCNWSGAPANGWDLHRQLLTAEEPGGWVGHMSVTPPTPCCEPSLVSDTLLVLALTLSPALPQWLLALPEPILGGKRIPRTSMCEIPRAAITKYQLAGFKWQLFILSQF